jgi:hypothetical protein
MRRVGWVVAYGLTAALAAGCARSDGRTPVYPVRGVLTWKGAPMAGATVVFHPAGDRDPKALRSHAEVGPDGTYRLTTYARHDGAPAGEYAVTVFWPGKRDPGVPDDGTDAGVSDQLKGAYRDPAATRLRAVVEPRETVIDFKLP